MMHIPTYLGLKISDFYVVVDPMFPGYRASVLMKKDIYASPCWVSNTHATSEIAIAECKLKLRREIECL